MTLRDTRPHLNANTIAGGARGQGRDVEDYERDEKRDDNRNRRGGLGKSRDEFGLGIRRRKGSVYGKGGRKGNEERTVGDEVVVIARAVISIEISHCFRHPLCTASLHIVQTWR